LTPSRIACCGVVLLAAIGAARALEIPAAPSARVNDYAGRLAPKDRADIEARLTAYERESSTQVVVAIFPALDGEDVEDFTNRLFTQWKLGQKGRDNGVLLTIFLEDRRARIEPGYGLEGRLTDALSRRILENELFPAFKRGDFAGGIRKATDAIIAATHGEYVAKEKKKSGDKSQWFFVLLVLIFVVGSLIRGMFSPGTSYSSRGRRRRTRRGAPWYWGTGGGGWSGGGGGFGGGGGWSGGGGGGGFSGGGGMSGGGGASGSW
jgi:uncharacterized protein